MLLDDLSKKELKSLLIKNWMSHDGSWFLNSYLRGGIDEANKLNKSAIRTLASFEIKRVKNLSKFKDKEIRNYKDLEEFIKDAFSVLKGDFMDFGITFPGENRVQWEMRKCYS
jgi:hypothetical protein